MQRPTFTTSEQIGVQAMLGLGVELLPEPQVAKAWADHFKVNSDRHLAAGDPTEALPEVPRDKLYEIADRL